MFSDIYVEDDWPLRRSYRLEDFLWSGSGDGQDGGSGNNHDPGGGKSGSTWHTTTIVHTTTILTTVYPTPLYTTTFVQEYHTPLHCSSCASEVTPSWPAPSHYVSSETIQPTPTFILPSPTISRNSDSAYLDEPTPLDIRRRQGHSRDAWLLIGAAIAAVCLLLLIIVLLALGLSKRKRNKRRVLSSSRQSNLQQEFEREGGTANLAYQDEADSKLHSKGDPGVWPIATKTSPGFTPVAPTSTVTFKDDIVSSRKRKGSSTSASSGESSGTSLVRRRPANGKKAGKPKIRELSMRQRESEREEEVTTIQDYPLPQPRKRQNITEKQTKEMYSDHGVRAPMLDEHERRKHEDIESNDELPTNVTPPVRPRVGTAISPNSFLSMPSIKAFPRGANIPEPLARVLEPVTVRHLDSEGRGIIVEPVRRLARHGSMEGEDPGVIGPLVWDLHCHRVQCQQQHEAPDDMSRPDTSGSNVGRMRRRFHELLDDAFSLFGSRSGSPGAEEDSSSPPTLHRVHSAIVRPRTSDPRRPATAAATVARPRGAWGTCNPSPHSGRSGTLPRPLSAGPFHRPQLPGPVEITIDRTLVLTDSQLPPTDPAIPLIAAIKEELRKFQGTNIHPAISLPGSTSKP
ncbi:hypothetical protein C0J52_09804 [Blattella germanica]|nr:hypothetical protein C0J52_09804 [Blattella germanica]